MVVDIVPILEIKPFIDVFNFGICNGTDQSVFAEFSAFDNFMYKVYISVSKNKTVLNQSNFNVDASFAHENLEQLVETNCENKSLSFIGFYTI